MAVNMSTEESTPKYLKLKAIAQELDVSESVIKRLIYSGELHSIKVGKEHRIERQAYERWKLEHSTSKAKQHVEQESKGAIMKTPDVSTSDYSPSTSEEGKP